MKNLKLNQLDAKTSITKLNNEELCNIVGAGCNCCADSGEAYRKMKRASKKLNEKPSM